MSIIRLCLIAGVVFYIGIFLIQGAVFGGVLVASVIGMVILLGVGSTLLISDEEQLKRTEMVLIWCCILAFAGYGILRGGGIV